MNPLFVDAGPLVALLDRRDRHHSWVLGVLGQAEAPLFTCEPVLTEACFLVRRSHEAEDALLDLIARGALRSEFRVDTEVDQIRRLMKKYADVPMSLADACLVRMSEINPRAAVLTLEAHFRVYRRNRNRAIQILMPSKD
jgi:predicted nucleic acid-binding protein